MGRLGREAALVVLVVVLLVVLLSEGSREGVGEGTSAKFAVCTTSPPTPPADATPALPLAVHFGWMEIRAGRGSG